MSRQLAISDCVLDEIEGHAYGASRGAASAVDRLQTREQIDARSDAHFETVLAGMVALAHRYPALLCEVGPLVAEQQRGIVTDGLEDEHCSAASADAAVAGSEARAIAGVCQTQLSAGMAS